MQVIKLLMMLATIASVTACASAPVVIDTYCERSELIDLNAGAIDDLDQQSVDQICRVNNRAMTLCPDKYADEIADFGLWCKESTE